MILLSSSEAARTLGVGRTTIQRWVNSGVLESFTTVGGHRRIDREVVRKFAEKMGLPFIEESNGAEKPVVLAVDDDARFLKMLEKRFRSTVQGMRLVTVTDAFEAGLLAAEVRPAAVILDLQMPEMDGAAVCRRIRGLDGENGPAHIVALTAFPREKKAVRGFLDAGGAAVFSKLDGIEELFAHLIEKVGLR